MEKILAGCKVNLCLRITGVREDGYHTLESLFWPINSPHDVLECTPNTSQTLTVECDTAGIDPKNNTLTKAYQAFTHAYSTTYGATAPPLPGVHIRLNKGIPHGAGLGGGSSNAAAVLTWCNTHVPKALTAKTLHAVALSVGADVPFFLYNKPAIVCGIGEEIHPCFLCLQNKALVVLCPDVHVSTAWAYAAWDAAQKQDIQKSISAAEIKLHFFENECLTRSGHNDIPTFACVRHYGNDFEDVVFEKYPQLHEYKKALSAQGALLTVMSGSGASIVGLFNSLIEAQQIADTMRHTGCKVFTASL